MIDYFEKLGLTDKQKKQLKKTVNYWDKDRIAKSQTNISNKSIRAIKTQMKKYYANTMNRTINNFMDTYEKILNARAEGKEPTPADLYNLDKYWQMQAQMRQELQKLGDKQIALLSKQFELNFFDVYYSFGKPGTEAFNTLNTDMVNQMINSVWVADGKAWSSRVWGNTEKLAETLNEELINCVLSGATTSDLKKKLQERFSVSYNNADMIARTELAHIQTRAAQQRYKDSGVKEVEVWADEDERRCEVCGKLHQKRFPVNETPPVPAHPRCRCCILPVIDVGQD